MLLGIKSTVHHLPKNISQLKLLEMIQELNNDPLVNGILIQVSL